MQSKTKILLITLLVLALAGPHPTLAAPSGSTIPTFSIINVVPDTSVTILTYNFPANRTFDVLMGPISTRGVGGFKVATINSGAGGSFTVTFDIPPALFGQYQIALRLENTTGSGYFAYNWFYNRRFSNPPANSVPSLDKPKPSIAIVDVVPDQFVKITTYNFPANDRFEVLMGYMGTRGIGGIVVDTIFTGSGGSSTYNFAIPFALRGQPQIAIRLQSVTGSGYYAYHWFVNNPAGPYPLPITPPRPGYSGFPTFTITRVVRDQTVTILTHNLPPNHRFQVTMGLMGTRGIGGYVVGAIDAGANSEQSLTFAIPVELYGKRQIAIRLQSTTGSYYAYNWFYNSTFP